MWPQSTSMERHLGQERYELRKMTEELIIEQICAIYVFMRLCVFCQMRYIQPFPGPHVSMDPAAVIDVYGLIGTPALWKEHAALVWRVGPAYMFEEVLSPETVGVIYTQGSTYAGNFLALRNTSKSRNVVQEFDQSSSLGLSLISSMIRRTFDTGSE